MVVHDIIFCQRLSSYVYIGGFEAVYICTFFSSCILLYFSERTSNKKLAKALLAIALLIPSIVAGVRDYSIGNDVLLYGNNWFKMAVQSNSLFDYISRASNYGLGVGYAAINFLFSRISHSPHIFYFCYELLILIILYFSIKPFEDQISIACAFLVFYFCYYNSSLNILRQIMAIVLVLFSVQFVIKKKTVLFLVVVLIASTFHTTALISLALYPFYLAINSKMKSMWKIAIIFSGFLFILGFEEILHIVESLNIVSVERYLHYLSDNDVGGRFVRLLYWGILFGLVILKKNRIEKFSNANSLFVIGTILSWSFTIISFIYSTWTIRIAYYFDVFQVISIPILINNYKMKFGKFNVSSVVILMLPLIYWIVVYVLRGGGATYPFVFMKSL